MPGASLHEQTNKQEETLCAAVRYVYLLEVDYF